MDSRFTSRSIQDCNNTNLVPSQLEQTGTASRPPHHLLVILDLRTLSLRRRTQINKKAVANATMHWHGLLFLFAQSFSPPTRKHGPDGLDANVEVDRHMQGRNPTRRGRDVLSKTNFRNSMELFTSVRVSVMDLIALLYRNQFLLSSVRGLVRRRESGVVKILEESDTTIDNISDSNYRPARTMRSEREPTLGTEMDI